MKRTPNERLSYQLRGPGQRQTIFVPGYADVTRHMLARLLELRKSVPMNRVDETEFQQAVEAARALIAKADGIEAEACAGGFAVDAYRSYCDQARQIMYHVRSDAWIDSYRMTQANRRKDKPATSDWGSNDGRNHRIRSMHASLVKAKESDATAQVARQFNLSPSQVRRIVARARA